MAGIFKAYDIRGIYHSSGDEIDSLSPHQVWRIGQAMGVAKIWPDGPVMISRDMRASSPQLTAWLAAGLRASGRTVRFGGLMTTPMHYWYNRHWQVAGSVQVTASHNPGAYNGLKTSGPGAVPIGYDGGLNRVEASLDFTTKMPDAVDALTEPSDLLDAYLAFLIAAGPEPEAPVRILADTGNGMAGLDLPALLARTSWLQGDILFPELDGTFPNHEANPLDFRTLTTLQTKLREGTYDLGVAFDGDADRAIFLAGDGSIITPDAWTAFIAEQRLIDDPGAAIVYDVRMSRQVARIVKQRGGRPCRERVGHSFMKQRMREEDASFGGEVSCHFYFRELGYTDSAIHALLTGCRYLRRTGIAPGDLNRLYLTSKKSEEINFRVPDTQKILQHIADRYAPEQCDYVDGLTVTLQDGWFNLRASNTEPVLRLNAEAETATQLSNILANVGQTITALGGTPAT